MAYKALIQSPLKGIEYKIHLIQSQRYVLNNNLYPSMLDLNICLAKTWCGEEHPLTMKMTVENYNSKDHRTGLCKKCGINAIQAQREAQERYNYLRK